MSCLYEVGSSKDSFHFKLSLLLEAGGASTNAVLNFCVFCEFYLGSQNVFKIGPSLPGSEIQCAIGNSLRVLKALLSSKKRSLRGFLAFLESTSFTSAYL